MVFSLYEEVLEKAFTSSFRAKSRPEPCESIHLWWINHRRTIQANSNGGDFSIPLRFSRNDDLFYAALDKNLKDFINDNPLIFNENDVVMIVKDIHRGKQNERDWERLRSDEKVKLSIDCWKFGMIFVMDRLKKEHYILRV